MTVEARKPDFARNHSVLDQGEFLRRDALSAANRARAAKEAARELEVVAQRLRATLAAERALFVAQHGWPPGRSITLYRLTWYTPSGPYCVTKRSLYSAHHEASADGWVAALSRSGWTPTRIVPTSAYTVEKVVLAGPEDVPSRALGIEVEYFRERARVEVAYRDGFGQPDTVAAMREVELPPVPYPVGPLRDLLHSWDAGAGAQPPHGRRCLTAVAGRPTGDDHPNHDDKEEVEDR